MDADDQNLSRVISPPSQQDINNQELRTLLIERVSATWKVIGRVALRKATTSVYCEQCSRWTRVRALAEQYTCAGCGTTYVAELVIYEELDERRERLADEHRRRERLADERRQIRSSPNGSSSS